MSTDPAATRLPPLWLPPLLLAVAAYAWLAIDQGTAWVFFRPVHEDGARTLAGTIFYWRHLLREMPVAVSYALAVLAAYGSHATPRRLKQSDLPSPVSSPVHLVAHGRWVAGTMAIALCGITWAIVVREHGLTVAWQDFAQYYVRDDELVAGSHWAAHYGSNLVFLCAAIISAAPWRRPGASWLAVGVLGAVLLLSALPLVDRLDLFLSPRAAAHQGREILTHVLVTLPIAGAILLGPRPALSADWRQQLTSPPVVLAGAVSGVVSLALLWRTWWSQAISIFPAPWSARLAAHLFEHTLDITLVGLLVAAVAPRVREYLPQDQRLSRSSVPADSTRERHRTGDTGPRKKDRLESIRVTAVFQRRSGQRRATPPQWTVQHW